VRVYAEGFRDAGSRFLVADGDGTVRADAASCDATAGVAEDVASNDVKEANDQGKDARCDDQAPEWQAQRTLAGGFLVHVPEHVEPDDHHSDAEGDEAMGWAEQRPIASKVAAEQRAL